MDFSGIPYKSSWGKLLRFPLRLLPKNLVVLVLQGSLRGKKWIVGSSNHGCWLGSYEFDKQKRFAESLVRGQVVYDVGAHVGFYTLLASSLIGKEGQVVAFEPYPRNLEFLHRHVQMNRCSNVKIVPVALADRTGTSSFQKNPDYVNSTGRLASDGSIMVSVDSIDNMIARKELLPPDVIKMDIEGGEYLALRGAIETLEKNHPLIFLATHGPDVHAQCCELLQGLEYRLEALPGKHGKTLADTDEIVAY